MERVESETICRVNIAITYHHPLIFLPFKAELPFSRVSEKEKKQKWWRQSISLVASLHEPYSTMRVCVPLPFFPPTLHPCRSIPLQRRAEASSKFVNAISAHSVGFSDAREAGSASSFLPKIENASTLGYKRPWWFLGFLCTCASGGRGEGEGQCFISSPFLLLGWVFWEDSLFYYEIRVGYRVRSFLRCGIPIRVAFPHRLSFLVNPWDIK